MGLWRFTGSEFRTYPGSTLTGTPGEIAAFTDRAPDDGFWESLDPPAPPSEEPVMLRRMTAGTAGFIDGTEYRWPMPGDTVSVDAAHAAVLLEDPEYEET